MVERVFPQGLRVAVVITGDGCRTTARDYAERLQAPLLESTDVEAALLKSSRLKSSQLKSPDVGSLSDYAFLLHVNSGGVRLLRPGYPDNGLYIDFGSDRSLYRSRAGSTQELVVRAVGAGKRKPLNVIDAAAGLGTDAFLLAQSGCEVRMIERNPVVQILLEDALCRGRADPRIADTIARMSLICGDACNRLPALVSVLPADVVYLDPMFPPRTGSAKVRLPMQYLQALAEGPSDQDQLLEAALAAALHRVVVKRPLRGSLLGSRKPVGQLRGKQCRFDIYAGQGTGNLPASEKEDLQDGANL